MKQLKFILSILILSSFLFSSCSTTKTLSSGKQIDNRLVGVWQGSEKDKQVSGMEKQWEMERNVDGSYVLNFTVTMDGESEEITDTGNWWVEGTTFYEYHDVTGKTETYTYTVLNDEQVKFEMTSTAMEFDDANYTFIDTKVSGSKSKAAKRDGLSIETAIKVKSIEEEYKYVREHCQDCQFMGQSLIEHNEQPYDVLRLKKPDGTEISYYFDISSFFGKW